MTGAEIATSRTTSLDKSVFVDGANAVTFEVSHSRYDGPLGKCNAIYKLTIVDYEVVVEPVPRSGLQLTQGAGGRRAARRPRMRPSGREAR